MNEFRELNSLLHKLDVQHSKAMKVDLTFEIFHQIAITIVLLIFSTSKTKTTSAMEAIFVPKGNVFLGINIDGYFIFTASMLIGKKHTVAEYSWSIANNFVIDVYCRCLEILYQIAFSRVANYFRSYRKKQFGIKSIGIYNRHQ